MNLRSGTLCWSGYLQLFISHDMQFLTPLDICFSFLDTEYDQFAMDCSFDWYNPFLFRFKQFTECHAVVTEFRIVSNTFFCCCRNTELSKAVWIVHIWHFPSWWQSHCKSCLNILISSLMSHPEWKNQICVVNLTPVSQHKVIQRAGRGDAYHSITSTAAPPCCLHESLLILIETLFWISKPFFM